MKENLITKIERLIQETKKPIPDKLDNINGQIVNLNLKAQIDQQCKLDKLIMLNTLINVPVIEIENCIDAMVDDITGNIATITSEDIYAVANQLTIGVTDKMIDYVLLNFQEAAENDPTASWNLIIEDLLFNYKD